MGGVSKYVTRQFLLVISLVKVEMSHGGEGEGSKKCRESVTYYLNDPSVEMSIICIFIKLGGPDSRDQSRLRRRERKTVIERHFIDCPQIDSGKTDRQKKT